MYKITGKNAFEVAPDTNPAEGLLDGTYYNLDIEKLDARTWHILKDHKSYYVQWIERSEDGKSFSLKINGQLLELNAKDHYDLLLEQMGMSSANTAKASKLKAPMPGKVLDILIEKGQAVAKGDGLLILEAMKMENVIKSPIDGEVKAIKVKNGEPVEKNQILIQFK